MSTLSDSLHSLRTASRIKQSSKQTNKQSFTPSTDLCLFICYYVTQPSAKERQLVKGEANLVVVVVAGDEECGFDGTVVGILQGKVDVGWEELVIEAEVVVVDAVVEGEENDLRHLGHRQVARDAGADAATVGKLACLSRTATCRD